MKRIAVACVGLLLLLAGCSSTPATRATPTPTPMSNEAAYLTIMHAIMPGGDDATWITIGHNICARLDEGQTPDQIAARLLATGEINQAGTRVLLRASVVTYCPAHEDVVPAEQ